MFLSMPVVKPEITIKPLFGETCYTSETVPVFIQINNTSVADTLFGIKMTFSEEPTSPTRADKEVNECFTNLEERINLLNSQSTTKLLENEPMTFYCKFATRG